MGGRYTFARGGVFLPGGNVTVEDGRAFDTTYSTQVRYHSDNHAESRWSLTGSKAAGPPISSVDTGSDAPPFRDFHLEPLWSLGQHNGNHLSKG